MVDSLPTSRITQACWYEQMLYSTQDFTTPELVIEEAVAGTQPGTADMQRLKAATKHSRAEPSSLACQSNMQRRSALTGPVAGTLD
jgi:hypothetical protein